MTTKERKGLRAKVEALRPDGGDGAGAYEYGQNVAISSVLAILAAVVTNDGAAERVALCWQVSPGLVYCDRRDGHAGCHSWEKVAAPVEARAPQPAEPKTHKLDCSEYHQHAAPKCCALDCWCRPAEPTREAAGFVECATCAAKPGSPLLCRACQHNRSLVSTLTTKLQRWKDAIIDVAVSNWTLTTERDNLSERLSAECQFHVLAKQQNVQLTTELAKAKRRGDEYWDAINRQDVTLLKWKEIAEKRNAERDEARALMNPTCADETLIGAIRNLQQAHLSEQGNVESLEQQNAALTAALRTCKDGRRHYCPNCDNSIPLASEALAASEPGKAGEPAMPVLACPKCSGRQRLKSTGTCASCGSKWPEWETGAAEPSAKPAQTVWLIEGTHIPPANWATTGLPANGPFPPQWWTGCGSMWSPLATEALRFARREDAERYMERERLPFSAVEHLFASGPAAQPVRCRCGVLADVGHYCSALGHTWVSRIPFPWEGKP